MADARYVMCYDTETGDRVPYDCALLELGGFIIDTQEQKIVEKFNWRMKPIEDVDKEPTDGALAVNHILREDIETFEEPLDVFNKFVAILDKYCDKYDKLDKITPMGFNIKSFDDTVMCKFFQKITKKFGGKCYWGSYFWNNPGIDVFVLAAEKLKNDRPSMENFKQTTIAKHLGIEVDDAKAHTALYDAKLCYQIYRKLGYKL